MGTKDSILIIDDDPKLRKTLSDTLKAKGYKPITAATGKKALDMVKEERPAIVLVDLKLGDMSGLEVLREIKECSPGTECIVLTGYASRASAIEAVNLGAYGYVQKPYDMEQLLLTIQRAIEKRETEEMLRESELWMRSIFNSLDEAVLVLTPDRKLVNINEAARKMFGHSKDELAGLSTEVLHVDHEHYRKFGRRIKEAFDKGEAAIFEFRSRRKNGDVFPTEHTVSLLKNDHEKPLGIVSVVRDNTERKQAEEKIKEYSENLEAMVEERTMELNRALYDTEDARYRIDGILKSVADGLIVTDNYNRIILMNRAAEDLLNVRFSKVIDRPIDVAIQDKTLRDRIKSTLEKRKTDYQFDFEFPVENAKHPRIMRARTSGIKDKAGNHTGIITIIHDVTHEREVDRMKTEFISTAAHEFRTPLTSIQGFSEILLMREDLKPEEKKKFLTHINNQSVSLANIINDLLDISRIESGLGFSLNKAPCDMADIIRGLVLQFQEQASKYYFEVILPEKPVELKADKEKMEQVLQNLLSNAVKYSPEAATTCLSAKKISDSAIEISVADQGIGMTHEQVEKIFDKFYRADASDTAIEGTGLGMSIVKYIVEAHGGKVWVESELSKGTTVTFTIPTIIVKPFKEMNSKKL